MTSGCCKHGHGSEDDHGWMHKKQWFRCFCFMILQHRVLHHISECERSFPWNLPNKMFLLFNYWHLTWPFSSWTSLRLRVLNISWNPLGKLNAEDHAFMLRDESTMTGYTAKAMLGRLDSCHRRTVSSSCACSRKPKHWGAGLDRLKKTCLEGGTNTFLKLGTP